MRVNTQNSEMGGLALPYTKDTLATRVVNLTRPHPFVTEIFTTQFFATTH